MPAKKRFKTKYPGVYYIESVAVGSGKLERIFYIMYRKNGELIEEKAGRQFQDDMTPARAAGMRTQRIEGNQLSNKEQREAIRANKKTQANRWTINRIWTEYKKQKSDSKSLRTDENRYQNYIKTKFGDKEPKELIQLEVDRLRINLLKKRKPQTVKHILALLMRIINFGVKKGLCQKLTFTIEMPRVNNLKTEDLTPEQLSNLLKVIEDDGNLQVANLMKMALFSGMRRGELFKLKWEDVDFHRGFISIKDPKGGPDQKIPLNEGAKRVLENHPRTDSPYIFPGRSGGQRTDVKRVVNRIKETAGLTKDFRALHGLRHTYASMLASSGEVDLYILQKLLTHKTPQMTQRYAHLRDEALKRASNLAGDIISQAMKTDTKKEIVNLEDHKK
jgi:integrase